MWILTHQGSVGWVIGTSDTELLFMTLRVCVCFRADIEVVQNDVSELETRLDKVRHMHRIHLHALRQKKNSTLSHCSTLEKCFPPNTHTPTQTHRQPPTDNHRKLSVVVGHMLLMVKRQWSEKWAEAIEVILTWQRAGSSCWCCFPIVLSQQRELRFVLLGLIKYIPHVVFVFTHVGVSDLFIWWRGHMLGFCSLIVLNKNSSKCRVTLRWFVTLQLCLLYSLSEKQNNMEIYSKSQSNFPCQSLCVATGI